MTDTLTARDIAAGLPSEMDRNAVTLPYSLGLLNGLFAVALHASRDDITPIIGTVQVTPRHFIATDRYSVGQWEHTIPAAGYADDPRAVMVPRTAAEWLTKQQPKALGFTGRDIAASGALEVTFRADSITVQWAGGGDVLAVTRYAPIVGNYPPVARLLPDTDDVEDIPAAPVALGAAQLEKFTKGCAKVAGKDAAIRIIPSKTANPAKPGPVLITFGQHFRGLLQPSVMLDRR